MKVNSRRAAVLALFAQRVSIKNGFGEDVETTLNTVTSNYIKKKTLLLLLQLVHGLVYIKLVLSFCLKKGLLKDLSMFVNVRRTTSEAHVNKAAPS